MYLSYRPTIKKCLLLILVNRLEKENQQLFHQIPPQNMSILSLYFKGTQETSYNYRQPSNSFYMQIIFKIYEESAANKIRPSSSVMLLKMPRNNCLEEINNSKKHSPFPDFSVIKMYIQLFCTQKMLLNILRINKIFHLIKLGWYCLYYLT